MTAPRILFFVPFGAFRVHNQLDLLGALAVRERGAEVYAIGCDRLFQECEVLAWSKDREQDCRVCCDTGRGFFETFGIPWIPLSKGLSSEQNSLARDWAYSIAPDDIEHAAFDGIPVGDWVISSIQTHFRLSDIHDAPLNVKGLYNEFLYNGLRTAFATATLFDSLSPSAISLFSGRFAPYRIAFELARARGIRVVAHERGLADDTFLLCENKSATSPIPLIETAQNWSAVPLSLAECEWGKQYFEGRQSGSGFNFPSFLANESPGTDLRARLGIPAAARIVGLFLTTEFELTALEEFKDLRSQIMFVRSCFEAFRDRPEYLVVRHHPYSGGDLLSPPDSSLLSRTYELFPDRPKNVRIVMPLEPVNSYELLWQIDAAIALFSTVALEASARGIPTAAHPLSPYRLGCLEEVGSTTAELSLLIDRLLNADHKLRYQGLQRAYRFCRAMTQKFSLTFKHLGIRNHFEPEFRFSHLAELAPGQDPTLDRFCSFLMNGTGLADLPESSLFLRPLEEETSFLETELARATEKQRCFRQTTTSISLPEVTLLRYLSPQESLDGLTKAWWIKASRAANFVLHALPHESEPSLSTLLNTLRSLNDEIVSISTPEIELDEGFSTTLSGILVEHPEINHAMCGAWILDARGKIVDQAFSKRRPLTTFSELAAVSPLISKPLIQISLGVHRRAAVVSLLEKVLAGPALGQAEFLFTELRSAHCRHLGAPLVYLKSLI